MKNNLRKSILCLSLFLIVSGVESADFGKIAADWRTDFAVPDAPAFKILNFEGSEIHRPTGVKDLTIAVSDFLKINNNITLPQMFAFEFSPGLLMGGKSLTINKYRNNPWLYRSRVSIATARDDGNTTATKLAIGIRSTTKDNSDLRTDTAMFNRAVLLSEEINSILVDPAYKTGPLVTNEIVMEIPEVKAKITELEEKFRAELKEWTEKNWNAHIDELAFAALFQSPDSTAEKLELQKLSAWFTSARRIGRSAQLLIGANASMTREEFGSDNYDSKITVSSRLYSGTNLAKVFVEGQLAAQTNQRAEWFLNTGGEMHIKDGFWIEFSAGGAYNTAVKHTRLVTEFEIKYGL